MSSRTKLLDQQLDWARRSGLVADKQGYVSTVEANLWRPLSSEAHLAFRAGSGQELTRKMMALHSSSALAVNFFDYWSTADKATLARALELNSSIERIRFEAQFPTGLVGNPPNLDVCIELASGHVVAIESKFSEWVYRKSPSKPPFKAKYFEGATSLWTSHGLPGCQRLAEDMRDGKERFEYFDAAQMLKHALGLGNNLGLRFSLWYAFYQFHGPESALHKAEVERFAQRVGSETRFRELTYQDLFGRLQASGAGLEKSYEGYLQARYFPTPQGHGKEGRAS